MNNQGIVGMAWLALIFAVSFILAIVCTLTYDSMRKAREDNVVAMLKEIHAAHQQYNNREHHFLRGTFRVDELNPILNLDMKIKHQYFFLEKKAFQNSSDVVFDFRPGEKGFEVLASFSKEGSAFLRDAFTIRVNERPVNLNAYPPNPCCVDYGLCPSLANCVLGK